MDRGRPQTAVEELDKRDFLMATGVLTKAIKNSPDDHELYFERSICYHKLGDFKASLEDAQAAIRLKPSDENLHYQKGLAYIGLSMLNEGIKSFKKAIVLRASREDAKLSDIFQILRDAMHEYKVARFRLGTTDHQNSSDTVSLQANNRNSAIIGQGASSDPVDSTSERHVVQPGTSSTHRHHHNHHHNHNIQSMGNLIKSGTNNNLVVTPRNNQQMSNSNQIVNSGTVTTNRVSSSANLLNNNIINNNNSTNNNNNNDVNNHNQMSSVIRSPDISSFNVDTQNMSMAMLPGNSNSHLHLNQSKQEQYEWNIRRSERIFLHSSEPGSSRSNNDDNMPIEDQHNKQAGQSITQDVTSHQSSFEQKGNSISRGSTKRSVDGVEILTYPPTKVARSKTTEDSNAESEVDVDDSYANQIQNVSSITQQHKSITHNLDDQVSERKRVMIAPSSSMPATSNPVAITTTNPKDDSYSSKYKRLRRDRERARRGTSKLCTIKLNDLEELQKTGNSGKKFLRVIAPIDGWLYSGQLSVDEAGSCDGPVQYVVKLDGDATGSSYLFSQETVLNDVIKEVRVNSVSELRKGARICCYWSRQYKCLSTGVVTSRTFEATKSLVSVKYDNGDLSALPLEDLRLLPPDYPKYMSNCDPLLLARNGDSVIDANVSSMSMGGQSSHRIMVDAKSTVNTDSSESNIPGDAQSDPSVPNDLNVSETESGNDRIIQNEDHQMGKSADELSIEKVLINANNNNSNNNVGENDFDNIVHEDDNHDNNNDQNEEDVHDDSHDGDEIDDDDDATIPPTDETLNFIARDTSMKLDDDSQDSTGITDRLPITKDTMAITNETQIDINNSRASSEENSYGIEYRPWMFEGQPKRSKRNGRTHREHYTAIRRGSEVLRIGDSAELMPRDESILPFIAKIDAFWATGRGEMRVRVRWYYRLGETVGEPYTLKDSENALFETNHIDENDVQSIYRSTKILSWTEYNKNSAGHVNKNLDNKPKIFYLAGYYDPVGQVKHLSSDVKEAQ